MLVNFIAIFKLFIIVQSAKILVVVPTPSISHQVVYRPLIQELGDRGHDITIITTDPVLMNQKRHNKINEIDLHDVSYTLWNQTLSKLKKSARNDMLSIMTEMFRGVARVFENQMKHRSIQQLVKDKNITFDLLMVETCIVPALIYTHIIKAPVIQISTLGPNPGFREMVGALTHPLLYPTHFHQKIYNLTIWQKINELYDHILIDRMMSKQELHDDIMLQNVLGIDILPLNEIKNNIHIQFLNIHPIWIHNQPVPINVIYTWGIYKKQEQILSKDLQSYLDSSKNGVIYVSFGTNVKPSLIPLEKREILLKVFSKLPYNILWKWDMDELPGKSENIKISKWFPQYDVLKHPNIKLFITQGGLQSTDEAITAGVPLIGIPMFADQQYNTEKYAYFNIGIQLDLESLTTEKFEDAIKTILMDDNYQKNIVHLRTKMHDQPKPALENAIWWVDYALRHGGVRHLRAPAANMPWTEYYELELVFLIFAGLTVLVTILLSIVYYCYFRYRIVFNIIKT